MLAEALSVKPAEHFSMFGCFGTLPPPAFFISFIMLVSGVLLLKFFSIQGFRTSGPKGLSLGLFLCGES